MTRKSTAILPGSKGTKNRDCQVAFFGYQLGFAGVNFPSLAAHLWQTVEIGTPVPTGLRIQVQRLSDVARRLSSLIPGRGKGLADAVAAKAEEAWKCFQGAWGGEGHRVKLERRDALSPGFCCLEDLLEGPPFGESVWEELQQTVEAYRADLPGPVAGWVRLGALVGEVLDPRSGGTHGLGTVATLQNHLAEMLPQPLLAGLPLDLSPGTFEQVVKLHDGLWARCTQGYQPGEAHPAAAPGGEPSAKDHPGLTDLLTKEQQALAILSSRPELPVGEIAQLVGCNRTSLYRMPLFVRAKAMLKEQKQHRRRGAKLRVRPGGSVVDGIDDQDPSEGVTD